MGIFHITGPPKKVKRTQGSKKRIEIWTDGACCRNQSETSRKAGYGAYFGDHDARNVCGALEGPRQTNNRAEMTAVIKALEKVNEVEEHAHVYTDSKYTAEPYTSGRINEMREHNFEGIVNFDLWRKLDKLVRSLSVTWTVIKGHSGIEGNEKADGLAKQGVAKHKRPPR